MLSDFIRLFEKNRPLEIISYLCCTNQYLGMDDKVKTCLMDFKEHLNKETLPYLNVPPELRPWYLDKKEDLRNKDKFKLKNFDVLMRKRLTQQQIDNIEYEVKIEVQKLRDELYERERPD